jgi:hypothetical protein
MKKAYTLSDGNITFAIDCPKIEHVGDATIEPNTYNVWTTINGAVTITKGQDKEGIMNNYIIRFTAGDECSIILQGWDLIWIEGGEPVIEKGKVYEISISENFATFINS